MAINNSNGVGIQQKKKTVMVSVCDGFQLPERTRFLNVELSKP